MTSRARATAPLLEQLRAATRAHHERLEARLSLLDGRLSRSRYVSVLATFYGFYLPVEAQLVRLPWERLGFEVGPRLKSPLLLRDLLELGHSPQDVAGLPRCTELPNAGAIDPGVGVLYVLEGATLGGRVIGRYVQGRLGLGPGEGGSFFHGYGPGTSGMWQGVANLLAACTTDPAVSPEGVVEGACVTFQTLEAWLSVRGVLA